MRETLQYSLGMVMWRLVIHSNAAASFDYDGSSPATASYAPRSPARAELNFGEETAFARVFRRTANRSFP